MRTRRADLYDRIQLTWAIAGSARPGGDQRRETSVREGRPSARAAAHAGVLEQGGPRARPAEDDPGPEPDPRARTDSPPAPAHGRLAVELLPGRRRGHGRRPRWPARQRADGATVRRCPCPELRTVGHAGAESGIR